MKNLISYEDAIKKAKECNPEYNECEEYTDAYYCYINDGIERIGGDTGVIIEKNGGNLLRWAQYFMDDTRKSASTGKITQI